MCLGTQGGRWGGSLGRGGAPLALLPPWTARPAGLAGRRSHGGGGAGGSGSRAGAGHGGAGLVGHRHPVRGLAHLLAGLVLTLGPGQPHRTPNTNHAGFFAAQAKGFYAARGLAVELLSAASPVLSAAYSEGGGEATAAAAEYNTPCGLVAGGRAHFALNSPEGVVNWNTRPEGDPRPPLRAVAAVLQRNTSAIACRPECRRPRDLDGKRYASYAARFEGRIVQRMIQNDGGRGDFEEVVGPMLGLWNTVLCPREDEHATDATWIFTCWEGVEAELRGAELSLFALEDYAIPYGYAPCLVAHPELLDARPETVRKFLAASAEGWEWAAANPAAAAAVLVEGAATECGDASLDITMVERSMAKLATAILDDRGRWGTMERGRWDSYLDWLAEEGLLTTFVNSRMPSATSATLDELRAGRAGDPIPRAAVSAAQLFTTAFLPPAEAGGGVEG